MSSKDMDTKDFDRGPKELWDGAAEKQPSPEEPADAHIRFEEGGETRLRERGEKTSAQGNDAERQAESDAKIRFEREESKDPGAYPVLKGTVEGCDLRIEREDSRFFGTFDGRKMSESMAKELYQKFLDETYKKTHAERLNIKLPEYEEKTHTESGPRAEDVREEDSEILRRLL